VKLNSKENVLHQVISYYYK